VVEAAEQAWATSNSRTALAHKTTNAGLAYVFFLSFLLLELPFLLEVCCLLFRTASRSRVISLRVAFQIRFRVA
jgi:Zn-dependent membrane protease YugP